MLDGDDDEEVASQDKTFEEPKVLGLSPGSSEKVWFLFWCILVFVHGLTLKYSVFFLINFSSFFFSFFGISDSFEEWSIWILSSAW